MVQLTDKQKRSMVLEYEELLIGKRKQFSSFYLTENKRRDSEISLEAFKYLFEGILCWSPQDVEKNLTYELLKKFKLDKYYLNFIIFENEPNGKPRIVKNKAPNAEGKMEVVSEDLVKADIQFLLKLIYKEAYELDVRGMVREMYDDVMSGKIHKFPKNFFNPSSDGRMKACIILQYAIGYNKTFRTIEELYSAFADINIIKLLENWRLRDIAKQFYTYPIDYLHDSLGNKYKDEQLYKLYRERYLNEIDKNNRSF